MSPSPAAAWQPLPPDVAEWMGLRESSEPEERPGLLVFPTQRGWRERLREALDD